MLTTVSLSQFNNMKGNIDDFYKVRKEIFVDRLNWDLSLVEDKEIDQFDHSQCHYLVLSDGEQVIGGARLTSSLSPNLTLDYFCNLLPPINPIERSADILEVSRFGIKQTSNTTSATLVKTKTIELIEGIFKFGLDNGYKKIVAITERRIERITRFVDLPVIHLSETKKCGNAHIFIGMFEITVEQYNKIRTYRLRYEEA